MHLRSGKITINAKIKTKGFNVKGRAADPVGTNVFISDDNRKLALANNYGVTRIKQKVSLNDSYDCETALNSENHPYRYVLIGYGPDWLYFGRIPLPLQGPRPSAKNAKYRSA